MNEMALKAYRNKPTYYLESFLIETTGNKEIAEQKLRKAVKRLEENPDDSVAAIDVLSSMKSLNKTEGEIEEFLASHPNDGVIP